MGKTKRKNLLIYTAFILYAAIMLWLLFGQRIAHRLSTDTQTFSWNDYTDKINLIPFHTVIEFIQTIDKRHSVINLAGNVTVFVPLGFFIPALWQSFRKFNRCMLLCAFVIILIEVIQLISLLGSCDIDDIILNMVGIAIGYVLFRALLKFASIHKRYPANNR